MIDLYRPIAVSTSVDETINYKATRAQVPRQVIAGNNIMCAGTNGDFSAMTFEEKVRLKEKVMEKSLAR